MHTFNHMAISHRAPIAISFHLRLSPNSFQSSFLSPIVYANFLRFRYFFSIHTRNAFAVIRARLDAKVVGNPKVHPQVLKAYEIARGAITRFGMAAVQQPAAPAQ